MIYSLKKIELLARSLMGDKKVFAQLRKDAPEMAALGAALVGNAAAMKWLLVHEPTLALFADAVEGNKTATQMLLKEKHHELAAVANMLNDDENAEMWLEKHNLKHFINLAVAIQDALDKAAKHDLGNYFSLYGVA